MSTTESRKPVTGETAQFLEHYVVVTDKDNGTEWPYTKLLRFDCPNVAERMQRQALKEGQMLLCGNTGEAEYCGTTGRTCLGEYNGTKWVLIKELTRAKVDIDSLYKLS